MALLTLSISEALCEAPATGESDGAVSREYARAVEKLRLLLPVLNGLIYASEDVRDTVVGEVGWRPVLAVLSSSAPHDVRLQAAYISANLLTSDRAPAMAVNDGLLPLLSAAFCGDLVTDDGEDAQESRELMWVARASVVVV